MKPGIWPTNKAMGKAERELAQQAEVAYRRTVADWQAQGKRRARVSQWGAIIEVIFVRDKQRGRDQPQNLRFSSSARPRPGALLQKGGQASRGT